MYDYSRSLTPSSIKGEEGSDEVVSELEENNETNNVMSAEKQARLRSSTIKDSRASEDKGVSTEQDYSSKTAQVRVQTYKTKRYGYQQVQEFF